MSFVSELKRRKVFHRKIVLLAVFLLAPTVYPQSSDDAERGWTVAVIKLYYARADEIALVLEAVLPPTVRIVPYFPTNSLIISGDPAVIGRLNAGNEEDISEVPPD